MFVCVVSTRGKRSAITADIAEAATALDALGLGNIIFTTLVDAPASVTDTVDAFNGSILKETANATDAYTIGTGYAVLVNEPASAIDTVSIRTPATFSASVAETTTAGSSQDGTVVSASVPTTWDAGTVVNVTLSGGNLTASN